MKESGRMIKLMEKASIFILMELSIRDNGKKTNSTVMERRPGQMVHATKDSIRRAEKMDMENLYGQMDPLMKELLWITIFTEKECTLGQTRGSIMDNGLTIKCTEREFSLGKMVEDMMESISMIRNKVMVYLLGLMEENMRVIG